jgi:hypothetical protein
MFWLAAWHPLKRFWWLIPVTIALVYAAYWRIAHDRLERAAEAQRVELEVARLQAEAKAARVEKESAEITRRVSDALSSDRDRERDRAASLSERLRDRENRLRACALSQAAGTPGGASGGSTEPGGGREIGEAIAALPAACLDDAARLRGWQDWYRELAAAANSD